MRTKLKLPSLSALSWVMVIILTACNILLIRQNSQLRSLVHEFESEQRIQIGEKLRPFRGADLNGKTEEVRFDEPEVRRIVLVSSTSCPFCKRQNPSWNQLAGQIDRRRYEVITLFRDREDRDHVAAYLKANGFGNNSLMPVFFVADEFFKESKLNSTPITLILGKDGVVEKAWFGLWDKHTIADVNSFLNISIQ
jgi:thiol-disulfide isomerase/thioredoxin